MKLAPTLIIAFIVSLMVSLVVGCSQPEKSENDPQWSQNMQQFRVDVEKLAPYLFSKASFDDPKNKEVILGQIEKFKSHAHSLNMQKDQNKPDNDPSLNMASKELAISIELGLESFKKNKKTYSRMVLKESLTQCFYCHSRNDAGPSYIGENFEKKYKNFNFNPLEMADYYSAIRNFDAAINSLTEALEKPNFVKENSLLAEQVIRKFFALVIRVKNDPDLIQTKISEWKKLKYFPKSIYSSWSHWEKALEDAKSDVADTKTLCQADYKVGTKFVDKAKALRNKNSYFASDIYHLYASLCFHNYLSKDRKNLEVSKVLFELGEVYSRLRDISFWGLSENYYELCIRKSPHTDIARKCFSEWDNEIQVGFGGSAGVFVPPSVNRTKTELKALSAKQKRVN